MAVTYPLSSVAVPLELMARLVTVQVVPNWLVKSVLFGIKRLLVMTVEVVPSSVAAWNDILPFVKKLCASRVPSAGLLFPRLVTAIPVRLSLMAGLNPPLAIPLLPNL